MKVLCCGFFPAWQRTLEFDHLRVGDVNRARRVVDSVGGKAANTARVLQSLGCSVENLLYMGFGGGETGKVIRRMLTAESIRHRLISTVSTSRICQTILSDCASDFTELIEDALPPADSEWQEFLAAFAKTESAFDWIVLSGTLPPTMPTDIYAKLISLTTPSKVLIDTSGPALQEAIRMKPAIVKINESELKKSVAGDSLDERLQAMLAMGVGVVGVTQGAREAVLADAHGAKEFHVPQVEVISTLGCGDSVNAGMVYALASGKEISDAFAYGLACGSANATTALPGFVLPNQANKLLSQIVTNDF